MDSRTLPLFSLITLQKLTCYTLCIYYRKGKLENGKKKVFLSPFLLDCKLHGGDLLSFSFISKKYKLDFKVCKAKDQTQKRLLITLRRIKEKKDQRLGIVGEKNLGRLGGYRKGERHTRKRNTKLFLADCLASRAASGIFLGEITPLVAAKVLDGNFRVFLYAIKKKRMEPHEIEITSVNRTETRGKKERKKHF